MNKSISDEGNKKATDATNFFKNLLIAGSNRSTTKPG